MDSTIANVSQLQKALQSLSTNKSSTGPSNRSNPSNLSNFLDLSPSPSPNIKNESTPITTTSTVGAEYASNTYQHDNDRVESVSSSKLRTASTQYSTTQVLYNLAGLQTDNNRKIDSLNDSIVRVHRCLEGLLAEQQKQTELLATIARNTMYTSSSSPTPTVVTSSGKYNKLVVKDYGFTNPHDVVAELLIKILKEIEAQVKSRGIKYRSSRTLTRQLMNQAVKIACTAEFKSPNVANKAVKLPENKDSATLYVASRIGAVNNINPILTAQAIRELFDDPECRTFMAGVEEVVERLSIIRVVLPYYEADMIAAISYPYFDQEGNAICDWSKLSSRSETADEASVITLAAREREKVGRMIAKGLPLKTVLRAIVKE